MDGLIEQAYRQVFFHAMRSDREPFLDSQLRSGNITVRDFIRGLLLSERFQQGYYQSNSNYRMVNQVVGRVLGRAVHSDAERRAWSSVIGERGSQHSLKPCWTAASTWTASAMTSCLSNDRGCSPDGPSVKRRSTNSSRATGPIGGMHCRIGPQAIKPLRCNSWRPPRSGSTASLRPSR